MKKLVMLSSAAVLAGMAFQAQAKVDAAEAAKLGKELTKIGAVKAGNGGAIPEYTGGLAGKKVDGYKEGKHFIDPYPDDKPEYTITGGNMGEHKAKLSAGHQKLLETYDTYKMDVYKTHRSAFNPEEIYAATIKNATSATLTGSDGLKGAKLGYPFPIPANGLEVLWNHKTRYRGDGVTRYNNQAIVTPDGNASMTKVIEEVLFTYGNIKEGKKLDQSVLFYYLAEIKSPPKTAGEFTLVHETTDQNAGTRNAWIYNPGQRRVRRAPNVGYDNPTKGTDGASYNDQVDMYNGAYDRYTYTLKGRQDMIVPYNSYRIASGDVKFKKILTGKHVNQDLSRYEEHRVWVVEGEVKKGTNHSFPKRTWYVDEDTWGVIMVDNYDKSGKLWRFQEAHMMTFYAYGATGGTPELIYDLQSGRYFATALANEDKVNKPTKFSPKYFTPNALKKKAR